VRYELRVPERDAIGEGGAPILIFSSRARYDI
jgi:hypothetical protein